MCACVGVGVCVSVLCVWVCVCVSAMSVCGCVCVCVGVCGCVCVSVLCVCVCGCGGGGVCISAMSVCVAPGLLSTKDPLKMESSLKASEELIRKEPSDLSEVRVWFVRLLPRTKIEQFCGGKCTADISIGLC